MEKSLWGLRFRMRLKKEEIETKMIVKSVISVVKSAKKSLN